MNQNEKFHISGDYNSLVRINKEYYKKAARLGYKEGMALCFINLANVNIPLQNYENAQVLFNKAESMVSTSKSNILKAKFYNDYGSFQLELKRLDKAFEYNEKALNYIKGIPVSPFQKEVLYKIYYKRAAYLLQKNKYRDAIHYFRKAGTLDDLGRADCAIGDIYLYELGKLDSAHIYLKRAADAANARGRSDAISLNANTVLGEYYIMTKEYDNAEKVLLHALEINKKIKHIFSKYRQYVYIDLKNLYEEKGDKEKAYSYLQAYAKEKDKSDTAVLKAINHDMEDFISGVEKDAQRHMNKVLLLCIVSLLVIFPIGMYLWKIIRQLKDKREMLKYEAEKLKSLMNDTTQKEVVELARKNDPGFLDTFKKAYPGFTENILVMNPDLENSDLVFCAMLKLHFTSKEIANYTCVQHKSVQQKKYRLRKKLNMERDRDIYEFLDAV
ncbi:tetratricopeptide repeat protein [Chryseobacterium oleae]|nr:hypothetical protein [Chryseobacterium oleae]